MIQEIFPRKFDNQYKMLKPSEEDYVLFFCGNSRRDDKILIKNEGGEISLPRLKDFSLDKADLVYLFSIDEENFFMANFFNKKLPSGEREGFTFQAIKTLRLNNPGYICFAGMTGYHLFAWYRDNQFCGRCQTKLVHDDKERMLKCPECGNLVFPKIAPAVIIGLKNKNKLMMSRYAGREYKGRALLAGFCEIGETPEETVIREVYEEVGLKVKNVKYFGSQPWGFDSNLLLGFFADLDGNDVVTMDEEELAEAGFVSREDIEFDPDVMSLTATMIEEFRSGRIE